jgi:hypothetical protein
MEHCSVKPWYEKCLPFDGSNPDRYAQFVRDIKEGLDFLRMWGTELSMILYGSWRTRRTALPNNKFN